MAKGALMLLLFPSLNTFFGNEKAVTIVILNPSGSRFESLSSEVLLNVVQFFFGNVCFLYLSN